MPRFTRFCAYCAHPDPEWAECRRSPLKSERFPSLKICSGCWKVWYCSRQCQRTDWQDHLFNCAPRRRGIDTVYLLRQATHEEELPGDTQTLIDYRFARAFNPHDMWRLFETYGVMMSSLDVLPQTLRRWRKQGRLLEGVFGAYYRPWTGSGHAYHYWLKENPHILDDSYPDHRPMAMKWAGMSVPSTPEALDRAVLKLPDDVRAVLWFCMMLLADTQWTPPCYSYTYLHFGFCACKNRERELAFGARWRRVLAQCSFHEVFVAYVESSLVSLFRVKGEEIQDRAMQDVLRTSPRCKDIKPVWHLKGMAVCPDHMRELASFREARSSYGFTNCEGRSYQAKRAEELKLLLAYKVVFEKADPLELHKAAVQNNLYDFVGRYFYFGEDAPLFVRFLFIHPEGEREDRYDDPDEGVYSETFHWEDGPSAPYQYCTRVVTYARMLCPTGGRQSPE